MRFLPFDSVLARGDIAARAALLYARLEGTMYRPETIFTVETAGWPGDWEGRTILALTMLAQTTGKEPAYLDEIVERLGEHCNEKGYMRQILPEGDVDEQQLSGHGWLLRGLCEYYLYRQEDAERSRIVLKRITEIVENLFLPTAGRYAEYPVLPEERVQGGEESGHIGKKVGHWYISSDTGCAYIPLDGLSQAYVLLDTYSMDRELVHRLKALLDEMVAQFYQIPFLEICVQTHATLTACRGILRLYEKDGDPEKLAFVEKIFKLYREEGMTANYANYNWFGRPEWTEPCAIIDSFMVAVQLYVHTGKQEYAEISRKILYNGLLASQRANGGFGTDTCAGAADIPDSDLLGCSCYEAYWCCSMRGGEGLASVSRYSVLEMPLTDGEYPNSVMILYPMDGIYTAHGVKFLIRTNGPAADRVTVRILNNPGNKPLTFWFPEMQYTETDKHMFCICGGEVVFDWIPVLHTEKAPGNHNTEKTILYAGYRMLGQVYTGERKPMPQPELLNRQNTGWSTPDGDVLVPLTDRYLQTESEIQNQKIRILW